MEFRVLGPVEVWDRGRRLAFGGSKPRAVLAVLLLDAGRVVSVERLIDELWDGDPPRGARNTVQRHVSHLRHVLEHDGHAAPGQVLVTRPPGYLLRVEPDQVDLYQFERLVEQAKTALGAGDPEQAARMLREALALWRGPALADVAEPVRWTAGARLEEARLAALEERIEADLALGRHGDLVGEVTALVAAHSLRERLRGQLMVALYRAGRQAEALAVYHEGRQALAEQLGLDPGPQLRELERKILTGDRELLPPSPATGAGRGPMAAELPPDIADFTGRAEHVDYLCDLLTAERNEQARPTAVVVSAVAGKGGVGKTTLAVHVAHRLRERFPDGQLYVNLHGVEAQPLDPGEVLVRLLRALGVEGAALPADVEERSALYRTRLAGRQVLVVLDNAANEAQVRPLLPGSTSCAVVVTSRARLAGLEGARLVDLDVLSPGQAIELLGRVAGSERVAGEPEAAEAIVRLCGYLPLAVRIAGARLATRPHWPLAHLVERLADKAHRLDELRLGDREVRASLALSYHGLSGDQRRCFRRLGLLAAADFASWAAAALLDAPLGSAEELIGQLVEAQLIDVAGKDQAGQLRYRFHDLLRVYARERAEAEESAIDRKAALVRALGAWLALAERASQRLPGRFSDVIHGPAPRWRLEPKMVDVLLADPLAWFESEHPALVLAVDHAVQEQLTTLAWDLAGSIAAFFEIRNDFDDWRHTHQLALAASLDPADCCGQAVMLRGLGELRTFQDRYDEALECFDQALKSFRKIGHRQGEAVVLSGIGFIHRIQGHYEDALTCFGRALVVSRETGQRCNESYVLHGAGTVYVEQGRLDEAREHFEEALDMARQVGYRRGEAQTLRGLGRVHQEQGRPSQALACFKQALDACRDLGDRLRGSPHASKPGRAPPRVWPG